MTADTHLNWMTAPMDAALAEVCASLFGLDRTFTIRDCGPHRVRLIGTTVDGATIDIPARLISMADIRVDYIS